MAWRQAVQLTQFLPRRVRSFVPPFVCLRGVEPQCRPHATPCGDSQTKEMCKSDLTLVGECVAEFLSDYRLVCQLARLQPNGFDRIGNSNESTEWHLLMTKVSYK